MLSLSSGRAWARNRISSTITLAIVTALRHGSGGGVPASDPGRAGTAPPGW
jgi:hypothetical protein